MCELQINQLIQLLEISADTLEKCRNELIISQQIALMKVANQIKHLFDDKE